MYTLYWASHTGAFAPQALLEEAGAEYEIIPIDLKQQEHWQPAYLEINPLGQVPTLILPEGVILTETLAMVLHLGDRFPQTGLVPEIGDPMRAQVYRWLAFLLCNLYETDLRAEYSDRYTSDPAGIPGVKAAAQAQMQRSWTILERALEPGPFFLQDRCSAVDLYLLMLATWWLKGESQWAEYPRTQRLCERVRERPAIQRIWAQNYG